MATASAPRRPSLRRRLVLGLVVTAAVTAFAEALLLHVVWYGYEQRLIEQVVVDELRRSVEIHQREPALAYPNTGDLLLYVASRDPAAPGDPIPEHLRPLLERTGDAGGDIAIRVVETEDGIEQHVGIAHRGERSFLLAYDAREHAERRTALLWSVVAIAVMITLAASRLALALVDRLLAGLSRLQRRAADGQGEGGFLDRDMDVEVASLADALDDQRRQVAGAFRKERAFAAAASHELRTPLTRIATGADVLLARPGLPEGIEPRIRSIRDSVDELQRLLDVLLQVARWQPEPGARATLPPSGAPRPLGPLVEDSVGRLSGEARLLGTTVDVRIGSPQRPVAHAAMLEIVLSNLLRNAIRHGRGAPVEVREADGVLEVVDGGPGIDAAALERVYDPFWRGDSPEDSGPTGLGLGLTIAERICAAAGWGLTIASADGRGTRAAVRLGPEDAA